MDVVAIGLALAAGPMLALGGTEATGYSLSYLNVAFGTLACVLLWLRRIRPVALAIALALLGSVFPAADAACAVALFTVAVHRPGPTTAVVAAVNLMAPVPRYLLMPDPRYPWWAPFALTLAGTAVLVAWGMWVRTRRQLVSTLTERAERAEAEQQLRVNEARRTERTQIAREMHDVLAHRISLLSMHAGSLEFRPDAPAADIAHAATVIRTSAHQALRELREVLGVLHQGELNGVAPSPQPSVEDIPALVRQAERAGLRLDWIDRLVADDPPPSTGRAAYRVVQEVLTNAHKHADGMTIMLSVSSSVGEGITIDSRNRLSSGPSALPGGGTGLVGLSERANLAGGRLEHGVSDDEFWLHAWLPWPAGTS